jgi:predicted DNA-binding protein
MSEVNNNQTNQTGGADRRTLSVRIPTELYAKLESLNEHFENTKIPAELKALYDWSMNNTIIVALGEIADKYKKELDAIEKKKAPVKVVAEAK